MTQALDAMVKAMAAEVARQRRVRGEGVVLYDEIFFEQVARAGLAAIREPTPEMSTAGKHTVKGAADLTEREQAESAFRVMIDKILEEKA